MPVPLQQKMEPSVSVSLETSSAGRPVFRAFQFIFLAGNGSISNLPNVFLFLYLPMKISILMIYKTDDIGEN